MYNNGLKHVHQLFEEGEYKTSAKVWEQYKLTKLRYNSLKVALPSQWKNYFKDNIESVYAYLSIQL